MSRHLNQIFMALMLCAALASPAAAQPTNPSGPLWTESSNAKMPADIARLNDHMNSLAEKLKPALVQVRVRRAAEAQTEGEQQPGTPEERRTLRLGRPDPLRRLSRHQRARGGGGRSHPGEAGGRPPLRGPARGQGRAGGPGPGQDRGNRPPVAALGDSNRIRVGEFVLALGQPFGLEQSVSFGIVSRKGQPLLAAAPASTSSRPTPPSIPATPAARSSTWRAR